jgi:hypothetical protein
MKHDVKFQIPWRQLGKSDVVFEVWADDEKLGRLEVSKGSLVWFPRNNTYGHKILWSQFDSVMQEYPRYETR